MAIVRDCRKPVDVMQLQVMAGDSEESAGKTIFAASELKWGAFRDVEERIGKYWIWGPLRTYAAYVFGAFKDLTWSCNALFRYTSPCDGCSQCQGVQKTVVSPVSQQPQQTRWWHAFIPKTPTISCNYIFSCFFSTTFYIRELQNLFLIDNTTSIPVNYERFFCLLWFK